MSSEVAYWRIGECSSTCCLPRRLKECCSSSAESLSLDLQEAEENFDLSLLKSLETDVVRHLGDLRLSEHLVAQLGRVLQQGSKIYDGPHREVYKANGERDTTYGVYGSTEHGVLVSRERFAYWCLDLLFVVCEGSAQGVYGSAYSSG
jgi:hypothetical protein